MDVSQIDMTQGTEVLRLSNLERMIASGEIPVTVGAKCVF